MSWTRTALASAVTPSRLLLALLAIVAIQRISELRLAKRNEAWARSQGAREVGAEHYKFFFPLHIGWLLGWVAEALLRGPSLHAWWQVFLLGFVLAEGLRYWAISSLGQRWNTRILVIDGLPPVQAGPYRFIAHPNYVAVAIELACLPLIFGAWITALVASVLNAALLLGIRIPAEQRAVREAAQSRD